MEAPSFYPTLQSLYRLQSTIAKGLLCGLLFSPLLVSGATINKNNNTTGLNGTGSWVGNVVPTDADIAQWTNSVAAGNSTVSTGANVAFGQIKIVDPNGTIVITSNTLTLKGVSGIGIDMTSATQDLALSSNISLSGNQTWELATGRSLTLVGALAYNSFNLGINGGGNFATTSNNTLGGTHTYTGTTTVKSGALTLTGNLSGTSSLIVNGGTLNNGETSLGATINRINPAATLVMGGTNGSSTYVQVAASSGTNSQTFVGLNLKAGGHTITSAGAAASITFSGTVAGAGYTREAGGFVNFANNSSISFTNAPTAAGGSTVTASTVGSANDILMGAVYAGVDFVSAKAGQVGAVPSYDSTFESGRNTNITTGTASGTGNTQSLRFGSGASNAILTLTGDLTIESGGILSAVNGTQTITGGTLRALGGSNLWIYGNSGNNLRINSVITDNGTAVGLEKYGDNTVGLGGNNTFTGAIFLQGGTLDLLHANALGLSTATASITVLSNSNLKSSVANVATAKNIQFNPGRGLTYDTNGFEATLSGIMSANPNIVGENTSAGNFTKSGNGVLHLTGSLATGSNLGFNINGGTLDITGSYASINPGWNMTGSNGTASVVTVRGNGVLSNTGDWNMVTTANNLLVINIQENGTIGAGRAFISKQAGAVVTINQDGGLFAVSSYFLGSNNGSATTVGTAFHQLNAGTLRLNANTANAIDTNSVLYLNGGTIQVNANGSSLAGNNTSTTAVNGVAGQILVKMGGGTVETLNANVFIISAAINHDSTLGTTVDGGLTKTGTGTLALSGVNTYTGDTRVNAGTLRLSNSLAVQNSTVATGSGAVVFDSTVVSNAFTFGGLSGATALTLANNAGTPQAVAVTLGNNNRDAAYSGNLTGAGSITKKGS
ncbi:MAG: beta strand repeat-containing protein, partial [Verrucomicrobium sp.]